MDYSWLTCYLENKEEYNFAIIEYAHSRHWVDQLRKPRVIQVGRFADDSAVFACRVGTRVDGERRIMVCAQNQEKYLLIKFPSEPSGVCVV